jgi:hypothetical protein
MSLEQSINALNENLQILINLIGQQTASPVIGTSVETGKGATKPAAKSAAKRGQAKPAPEPGKYCSRWTAVTEERGQAKPAPEPELDDDDVTDVTEEEIEALRAQASKLLIAISRAKDLGRERAMELLAGFKAKTLTEVSVRDVPVLIEQAEAVLNG